MAVVLTSPCRKMRSHRLCLWPVRGAGSRGWFVVGEIPAAAMQHYALQAHAVSLAVSHTKAGGPANADSAALHLNKNLTWSHRGQPQLERRRDNEHMHRLRAPQLRSPHFGPRSPDSSGAKREHILPCLCVDGDFPSGKRYSRFWHRVGLRDGL